jgi:predicted Zn-dependent protease
MVRFKPRFTVARLRALLAAIACAGFAAPVTGQGIAILRDAETEAIIRGYAAPVLTAAGLEADDVRIHLVNDPALNAFVAGGMRIFIHTGLILRSQNPGQIIGVIAHESGHIAGAHLARVQEELKDRSVESIAALVLGAAAAVATGRPDAGMAIISGGATVAQRSILQYSRTQESAADQAAVRYLDQAGISSRGLLEFMDILADQELMVATRQSPYLRTHPFGRERVEFLQSHVNRSPYAAAATPPHQIAQHKRMVAKLMGYLDPARALNVYKADDKSIPARYARAFGYYRNNDFPEAERLINAMIAEMPNDPYFYEFKAQILFETGRIAEALEPNQTAVRLAPHEALLKLSLAQNQIETNDPVLNGKAIAHLEEVVRRDPKDVGAWRYLGIAYGRADRIGHASLALAENAMLRGDIRQAQFQAGRAERDLPRGSPEWLRAQDIKNQVDRELSRR